MRFLRTAKKFKLATDCIERIPTVNQRSLLKMRFLRTAKKFKLATDCIERIPTVNQNFEQSEDVTVLGRLQVIAAAMGHLNDLKFGPPSAIWIESLDHPKFGPPMISMPQKSSGGASGESRLVEWENKPQNVRRGTAFGAYSGSICTWTINGTTSLLVWLSTSNHDYWEKRGVPYSKPMPLVGSLYESFANHFHEIEVKRYFKYGPVYGHFESTRPVLSVADATLLRDILVKDFQYFTGRRSFTTGDTITDNMVSNLQGEPWKRVRSIITPTFTTGKIKRMLSIFKDCSRTLVENFRAASKEGKPVDCKRIYGAFTMDIIASSAFSTKIDSHNDPDNEFVRVARSIFMRNFNWRFILFITFPTLMKFFKIAVFGPPQMNFFKNVTREIIEERKKTGQTRNDFLQLLLDTAKEVAKEQKWDDKENDIASNYGEDTSQILKTTIQNKNLSMDELVAQCVIFFIAGYDTTASTLSFASYLLALNPDKQELLRQEVDSVLKEYKGDLSYEALQEMKYLDNVISETLRLYPPAVRLERVADADYKLGDTGITVPKGMVITIPNYALHKDPKFYPEPEKFEPDRFTPEERSKRDPLVYLPFGSGPRNCIGMRFALMEIKVCLAYVIANFNIKRCPQTKVPLDFYRGQGLLQPRGIILDMEIRKDAPLVK